MVLDYGNKTDILSEKQEVWSCLQSAVIALVVPGCDKGIKDIRDLMVHKKELPNNIATLNEDMNEISKLFSSEPPRK